MGYDITGFISLTKFKLKKILINKRIVAALIIAVIVGAVMGYASTLDIDRLEGGTALLDILILSFFLPIIAMYYSSSVIREEIEDNSITQVLTSPMRRATAYLSYYTALILSLIILMFVIVTAGFLSFFVPLGIDSEALDIYKDMLYLVIIGSLIYSTLFLMVSLVLERSIYFGLFYAFIWEGFVGSLPGRISELSIKHYIRSIGAEWIEYLSFSNSTDIVVSFQILILLFIVLIIIGALLFRYKEFPG